MIEIVLVLLKDANVFYLKQKFSVSRIYEQYVWLVRNSMDEK